MPAELEMDAWAEHFNEYTEIVLECCIFKR